MNFIQRLFQGVLPPVGHPLVFNTKSVEAPLAWHKLWSSLTYHSLCVDSGTSALALALMDACQRRKSVTKPVAIIPGYCCPDLVAACEFAGVRALAVDIRKDAPGYDLSLLEDSLNEQVIAVIAVNFLGVAEQLPELRRLLDARGGIALIEDNAQWFPLAASELSNIPDYVVFSFGRGKPLSLLGGGLLLSRLPLTPGLDGCIAPAESRVLANRVKASGYNWFLQPFSYQLLCKNPFLHLGQTRFQALTEICQLDNWRLSLLAVNYAAYQERHCASGALARLSANYRLWGRSIQQWRWDGTTRAPILLRYPLLCASAAIKRELLVQLNRAGLGASSFYPAAIDQIPGVDARVLTPRPLAKAQHFAECFISLPLHQGVTEPYQQRMRAILQSI